MKERKSRKLEMLKKNELSMLVCLKYVWGKKRVLKGR